MENWDKGIKMFDEAAPVDKKTLDRLRDLDLHRRANVHFISTRWRPGPGALVLVMDPVTGAYGLPEDKGGAMSKIDGLEKREMKEAIELLEAGVEGLSSEKLNKDDALEIMSKAINLLKRDQESDA